MTCPRGSLEQRFVLASLCSSPGHHADDRDNDAERENHRPEGRNPLSTGVTRPGEDGVCLLDSLQKPAEEGVCCTSSPGCVHAPAKPTDDRSGHHEDDAHDEDGHACAPSRLTTAALP